MLGTTSANVKVFQETEPTRSHAGSTLIHFLLKHSEVWKSSERKQQQHDIYIILLSMQRWWCLAAWWKSAGAYLAVEKVCEWELAFSSDGVLDRFFFEWVDGKSMWMYGQKLFFGHKANWVSMKFRDRKFKVMNHWGFWQSFTRFFLLLEFFYFFSSNFFGIFFHVPFVMDNGVLFIGNTLWIFERLEGANIMQ